MKLLKYSLITCLLSSFSIFGFSQKAELTTIVTDPSDNPVSGIVLVHGNDSTWNASLEDGSAYFILKTQTGIENYFQSTGIKVFPNPIRCFVNNIIIQV